MGYFESYRTDMEADFGAYISGSSIITASVVPRAAKIEADQNNSPMTAGRERIAPATDPKHSKFQIC